MSWLRSLGWSQAARGCCLWWVGPTIWWTVADVPGGKELAGHLPHHTEFSIAPQIDYK
jgi:hypothetical protein